MQIVTSLDRDLWKKFVDENPQGNIFQTPEMYDVFSRAKGHRPSIWAAVEGNDRVLALLLPVEIVLFNPLRWLSSRSVVYGGALCEPSQEGREGLSQLLEYYKRKAGGCNLFTELRNVSDATYMQPVFCKSEFHYEDHLNYLIDLDRAPEDILKSISNRTRKHISRGLRKGLLKVDVIRDRGQLEECYNLLKKTYRQARIPIAPKSLFEAAFDVLSPNGMVKFLLACVEGVPVAASIELLYKDVIYGWYSGMDRSYTSHTPNELLMWHILSWGAENGYRLYDFGGAGRPNEKYGVRDFKAKFNGQLVNYGRNTVIHAPVRMKLSKFAYQVVRNSKLVREILTYRPTPEPNPAESQ